MTALRLPDFVVIGARKSGTTWLDGILRQHPGIHLPSKAKELFFFDRYWDRGLDWYRTQLVGAPNGAVVGEITPSYLASPQAVDRMAQTIPGVRLVALLRDPVARAWSDYQHALRKGDVRGTFEAAAEQVPSILDESRYATLLERWSLAFGHDRIRVVVFEELVAAPGDELASLLDHIGAPAFAGWRTAVESNQARAPRNATISAIAHRLSRAAHRSGLHGAVSMAKRVGVGAVLERTDTAAMPHDLGQQLAEEFRPEVSRLAVMWDLDVSTWSAAGQTDE